MSNKELLKEFIRACLEESFSATVGSVSTKSMSATSSTKASNTTSSSTSSVNNASELTKGESEIDGKSQAEQDELSSQVEDNKNSIIQAGEVAGKVSAATLKMKTSNKNITDRQRKIADANKVLARSEKKEERERAYNDISQANTEMAGEINNVMSDQDIVVNALRRQSDAANKLK